MENQEKMNDNNENFVKPTGAMTSAELQNRMPDAMTSAELQNRMPNAMTSAELQNRMPDAMTSTEQQNGTNKVLPVLGAFLGAIFGTIPWILIYIYVDMMISMLAVIIAFCSLKGYKICKGQVTKGTSTLIVVSSIVAVIIATLVIIPLCLLSKGGYEQSLYNLMIVYKTKDLILPLIIDTIIAILFTVLGISGVVKSIK